MNAHARRLTRMLTDKNHGLIVFVGTRVDARKAIRSVAEALKTGRYDDFQRARWRCERALVKTMAENALLASSALHIAMVVADGLLEEVIDLLQGSPFAHRCPEMSCEECNGPQEPRDHIPIKQPMN